MKPILVSSGEPAGIGIDLCLALADLSIPVVVIGDKSVIAERAALLDKPLILEDYQPDSKHMLSPGHLTVISHPVHRPVIPGQLETANAPYVMTLLLEAAKRVQAGEFSALVTAPVHKGIINDAGIPFSGHTEFFAQFFNVAQVVMLLVSARLKIALMTTHLPLKDVPQAISHDLILRVIQVLHQSLVADFGIADPKIAVAGLNPHAGEGGHLGLEEQTIIQPALARLKDMGIDVSGPWPADTIFNLDARAQDAFVAMYHDQGLPVIKYADFDTAVNVTLGLPIVRTSVDHGTALSLAGTGKANPQSLLEAVKQAVSMARRRGLTDDHH